MVIIGLFLNVAALGLLCWALYSLAIHALPVFLGVRAFFAIEAAGQGEFIAILGGLLTSGTAWGVGRTAFALIRSVPLRLLIGIAFGAPAAFCWVSPILWVLRHRIAVGRSAADRQCGRCGCHRRDGLGTACLRPRRSDAGVWGGAVITGRWNAG
jgi:hypothetical protein